MIITLNDTTSAKISAELLQARRSAGSPAQGMVLTLIIVCDESEYTSAMEASVAAGREHPSCWSSPPQVGLPHWMPRCTSVMRLRAMSSSSGCEVRSRRIQLR